MEIHDHTIRYKLTAAKMQAFKYIRHGDLNFDWYNMYNVETTDKALLTEIVLRKLKL